MNDRLYNKRAFQEFSLWSVAYNTLFFRDRFFWGSPVKVGISQIGNIFSEQMRRTLFGNLSFAM